MRWSRQKQYTNINRHIFVESTKKSLYFSKYCILIMKPSILKNFGTLSKPTYCLSESSWKIT